MTIEDSGANTESMNGVANGTNSIDENQDEQIMLQTKEIEDEIKRTSKLIGDAEDLTTVQDEFKQDPVYLAKVIHLGSKYSKIRRTRPDGNCFFRSLAFAYFEKICQDSESYQRFHDVVSPSKDMMIAEGFSSFAVEDFYDSFMEQLEKIDPRKGKDCSDQSMNTQENNINVVLPQAQNLSGQKQDGKVDKVIEIFNDQGLSDYIVVFLRLVTSMHLKKESDFYQNFMEGDMALADFCSLEVEPMYHESDHIHVIAITKQTGIKVRIQYLDRGNDTEATAHDFPEGTADDLDVHLLYRPGHYDILYPKN